MSDYKDIPSPPPDDFTKTTPNIRLPGEPLPSGGGNEPDWAKTNYKIPTQASANDDFGKTMTNIKPIDTNRQDFGKTMYPGASAQPQQDWGATQANINLGDQSGGGNSGNDWGSAPQMTTPYFQLPEADKLKYQNLPPTPTQQAEQNAEEKKSQGGIPGWVWTVAGMMVMFFFAIISLAFVYFVILRDTSFEVTIVSAPAGSDIKIEDRNIGVSDEKGDSVLKNLAPGKKTIIISHPSYKCDPITTEGGRGVNPAPIVARCVEQINPTAANGDCTNFEPGEDDRAETCYNSALAALPDPYTADQLVSALNILIINFETNRFDVPPRRYAALIKAATYIKKLPADVTLEIGGHTDSDGDDARNMTLSINRAKAVKDFLVKNGVNGSILQEKGFGASKPKKDNATPQGKYMNRRIEYTVIIRKQ